MTYGEILFPYDGNTRRGVSVLEDMAVLLDVDTGYVNTRHEYVEQEWERMRRLTFFRVPERTLDKWRRESDEPVQHNWRYWNLMHYWLATWEQVSGHEWDKKELERRSQLLIELLCSDWLEFGAKEDWKITGVPGLPEYQKLQNEAAYFSLADSIYYDGGLCYSFESLENGIPFETVFPVELPGFSWGWFRVNTGRLDKSEV